MVLLVIFCCITNHPEPEKCGLAQFLRARNLGAARLGYSGSGSPRRPSCRQGVVMSSEESTSKLTHRVVGSLGSLVATGLVTRASPWGCSQKWKSLP